MTADKAIAGNKNEELLQFATDITDLCAEREYDFGTIFNGITVALAAFLVDYSSFDGKVDMTFLETAASNFDGGLRNAIAFGLSKGEEQELFIIEN